MEFRFREMTSEDKPQVSDFLKNHFGNDSVQCRRNRFEWQFERYPGGTKIYLCFHDHKLVAQICFLPVNLQLKNERLSGAFSIDTMVTQEYQRKGIGEKFHQLRLENFQVALSSGQSEANAKLYKKMGWSILGKYFEFRLVKRFPKLKRAKLFAKDILNYSHYKCTLKKYNEKPRIIISSDYPKELSQQLDRGLESEAFIRVSCDYLNWRYGGHPYFKYSYIQVFDGHKWLGTCVARISKPGYYRLVDFYCSRQNFPALLEGIAHPLDGYCIEGELAGVQLRKYFVETGFSVVNTNQHIMGSSKDEGVKDKLSKCDWLIFGGDSDNDR